MVGDFPLVSDLWEAGDPGLWGGRFGDGPKPELSLDPKEAGECGPRSWGLNGPFLAGGCGEGWPVEAEGMCGPRGVKHM